MGDRQELKMNKMSYYLAANSYEGCGHKHKSKMAALRCLAVLLRRGAKVNQYHIYQSMPTKGKLVRSK
jgi:hypothetical protein